jgi:lysophospholipase L1-like esterase
MGIADHKVRDAAYPASIAQVLFHWRTYRLVRSAIVSQRFSLRVPLDNYRENLRRMVLKVRQDGGKSILIAPIFLEQKQGWLPTHIEYMDVTKQVATTMGVPYIDLQKTFADKPELFMDPVNDQVHFNWDGANLIANAIAETAVKNGMLP